MPFRRLGIFVVCGLNLAIERGDLAWSRSSCFLYFPFGLGAMTGGSQQYKYAFFSADLGFVSLFSMRETQKNSETHAFERRLELAVLIDYSG